MENKLEKIRDDFNVDDSVRISKDESQKIEDELRKLGYIN